MPDSVVAAFAGLAIRCLALTWRVRVAGVEHLQTLRAAGTPFIFALWHGQMLPLLWHHRNRGVALVISEHRDGERIAGVARRFGYDLVRGSTTRGGGRALIQLSRVLESGGEAAITPDGPRGPARSVAQGVVVAAQRTGAPVLPVAAAANRAWKMSSWDSFVIPKPFAKVVVSYAPPIYIRAESSQAALRCTTDVSRGIDQAERSAEKSL